MEQAKLKSFTLFFKDHSKTSQRNKDIQLLHVPNSFFEQYTLRVLLLKDP